MRRSTLPITLLLLLSSRAAAQSPIRYEIAFPNAAHHEAEISVTFPDLGPGPLEVRMSRTSPGRYALHEFAKNVYNFRATGVDGRDVEVARPDLHQWTVTDHGGEVTVRYTLYGDHADGTRPWAAGVQGTGWRSASGAGP